MEFATLFVGTGAFSSMAVVMDLTASADMVARTTVSYVLLVYAVYVPSTARRTLIVATLMTVPLLASIFIAFSAWDPALYDPPAATWPKGKVGDMAYLATTVSAILWAIVVAMAVAFSHVVHGLRRAVTDIKRLGQYTLEEKLGEGGMGVVYRASHGMLRRPTEVCAHHLHSTPEPPSIRLRAPVPADLEAVVLACLTKLPEDRPASAHVVRERLAACAAAAAWTNKRASAWWTDHRHQLRSGGAEADAPSTAGDIRSPHLTVTRITQ